jgi:hypothetical protein
VAPRALTHQHFGPAARASNQDQRRSVPGPDRAAAVIGARARAGNELGGAATGSLIVSHLFPSPDRAARALDAVFERERALRWAQWRCRERGLRRSLQSDPL